MDVHILSGESMFWRMLVCFFGSVFWFSFFVKGCVFLLPTAIILRIGMVFPPFY